MVVRKPIKVLIGDNRVLVREGLRQLLPDAHDISVFVEATDLTNVLHILESNEDIDVVLLGESLIADVSEERRNLLKTLLPVHALLVLIDGGPSVSKWWSNTLKLNQYEQSRKAILAGLRQGITSLAEDVATSVLSLRQQEILALLEKGMRNKQIAGELEIAETTVREHVSRILRVLSVDNRSAAVAVARAQGLLQR